MTKIQLIDQIRQYNHSVQDSFLSQFDEAALAQYLTALENAHRKSTKTPAGSRPQDRQMRMVS